jgi:hypothetical protein
VKFLSEPTERFYGIEATLRDNSGNWFSMVERTEAHATPKGWGPASFGGRHCGTPRRNG